MVSLSPRNRFSSPLREGTAFPQGLPTFTLVLQYGCKQKCVRKQEGPGGTLLAVKGIPVGIDGSAGSIFKAALLPCVSWQLRWKGEVCFSPGAAAEQPSQGVEMTLLRKIKNCSVALRISVL